MNANQKLKSNPDLTNTLFSKKENIPARFWPTLWKNKPCVGLMLINNSSRNSQEGSDTKEEMQEAFKNLNKKFESFVKKLKAGIAHFLQTKNRKQTPGEIISSFKAMLPSLCHVQVLHGNMKISLQLDETRLDQQPFNPKNAILEAFEDISPAARKKNVELIAQFEREFPSVISFQIEDFKSLITTLLLLFDQLLSHSTLRLVATSEDMKEGKLLSLHFYAKMNTRSIDAPPIDLLDRSPGAGVEVGGPKVEAYYRTLNYYFILYGIKREAYKGLKQLKNYSVQYFFL